MHNGEMLNKIKNRRSIRNWLPQSIPNEKIEIIIEAARWAPSSCNRQSTRFLVITNPSDKELVTEVSTGGKGFANYAPCMIIVLSDIRIYNLPYERNLAFIDGALACQNLMLQADTEGLGTCYLNWALEEPIKEQVLYKHFNIPHYMIIIGVIPIGYPDYSIPVKVSERKPIKELIIKDKF
ncbi:nitroreductase family protein [Neobacillus sp. OS1-33]|uniref:nitroreductase family protein n=1 Tax=Neobacillus sp. OS1-33 TaxID=3070683 RepID=UPI0027DF5DBC|nr:nitroreductase family protein [Neobacillus sp. OS1-33]WML24565.1 nitroreductase family protein [Neobacillus sp. OS1-33]